MNLLLIIILCLVMLVMAITAIAQKKLTVAVIASGMVGLMASVLYLLMAAPDVAMTEAAIGSGLTTVLFFYVLFKIKKTQ
ncbi:MAG: DUF4040 domain-containing protein [Bacteroidetes bacterium]|nr:DUF4040 domain-containing protein [Bacteroidota bacterium]